MPFLVTIKNSLKNVESIKLFCEKRAFKIAGEFRISRGAKKISETVFVEFCCQLKNGQTYRGRGESIPYGRYGESCQSVIEEIESVKSDLENNISLEALQSLMGPGAARNAVDSALWDLRAKVEGRSVWSLIKDKMQAKIYRPLTTAFTLSVNTAAEMGKKAKLHKMAPMLKIKLTGDRQDMARVRAVLKNAPNSQLILDANEAWTLEQLNENAAALSPYNIALIEQPLRSDFDYELRGYTGKIPICADESCHDASTFNAVKDRYHAINIKLDKTGGLTDALLLKELARKHNKQIMVGCMVGTSLGTAPALLLAQDADVVDLDAPLLMAEDYTPAINYEAYRAGAINVALWG